ncbi:hypothetical protein Pan241w_52300 [Gimesia alba]|uniref:Uncharacterized protein n=1 Tax=Gimesia alba TaxID=2527973 RepID=A0A517RMR7_9PLAN|nr:hypothetical protein [Gimesia alba]QDT45112.1 hypothetical protein Pan241w_52300 [Gimesia alba]
MKLSLISTPHLINQRPGRAGSTLMEVLMSILIMSVGVISLASLFPVSILNGVQATNLTNGTILRYNAEALIDSFPGPLVHDPDADGNYLEHRSQGFYIVDPLGYYAAEDDNNTAATTLKIRFGNDGNGNRNPQVPRYDAGFYSVALAQALAATPTPTQAEAIATAKAVSRQNAFRYFSSQDSWTRLYDVIPVFDTTIPTPTPTSVMVDLSSSNIDLVGLKSIIDGAANGGRLVLFDSTGKQAQVRPLTSGNINDVTGVISWTNPLPANPLYEQISRVLIEIQDPRYSYFLTVRHEPNQVASVDVVVFFRRNLSPEFEALHDVEDFVEEWLPGPDGKPGVAGVNDDGINGTDDYGEFGALGSDDYKRTSFRLYFNANYTNPLLKKGGYIFDHQNARWYRIQNFEKSTNDDYADIVLEQPILESITRPSPRGGHLEGVIVMPNVVQVYSLGNKLDPDNP